MKTQAKPERHRIQTEFHAAALRARELVTLLQALEARVCDLGVHSPEFALIPSAELVKASAPQIPGLVHELLVRSERVALDAARRADLTPGPPSKLR